MNIALLQTSEAASTAYARRVGREVSKHGTAFTQTLAEAVKPAWDQIKLRGKLPQRQLLPETNAILARLRACHNILFCETIVTRSSPLSCKELCTTRLIVALADPSVSDRDRIIEFLACDLTIERHHIDIRLDMLNFTLSSHVISRYVQRGRGDHNGFFAGLVQTMRVAPLLAIAACHHDNSRVILPHRGGFLLASVTPGLLDDNEQGGSLPFLVRRHAHGFRKQKPVGVSLGNGMRLCAHAWSYIDIESAEADGPKEALYRQIKAWMDAHGAAISNWFDIVTFGDSNLTKKGDRTACAEGIVAAQFGAKALSETPEWARFARVKGETPA